MERQVIVVGPDEKRVNDQAVGLLAKSGDTYQRAGELVRIGRRKKGGRWAPVIEQLPAPSLREKLSEIASFQNHEDRWLHPPDWCVSAIIARNDWQGLPHLSYAVEYPVLRPDGTVLQKPGYDIETQLFYQPSGDFEQIPEFPTQADVVAARERLLDLIVDFPFSQDVHRSGFLAGLLTFFARPAYDGATPFFLIDANVRGAGKSFLAHVAGRIATGRRIPTATQAADEAEEGKVITAVARAGDVVKLIDNIARPFGNGKFDAALTSTVWEDRVLGQSDLLSLPLFTIWWGTGNNVQFHSRADTARRTLHIRLLSPDQNPERRTDWKHPHLERHIMQHRKQLVADCLTLLRAYQIRKQHDPIKIPNWGSFEEWSAIVRGAIVHAGLADPIGAAEQLAEMADTSAAAVAGLVAGWRDMLKEQKAEACSARDAIDWLAEDLEYKSRHSGHQLRFKRLLDALGDLCTTNGRPLPDARQLGCTLRSFRGRVVESEYLETLGKGEQGKQWTVKKR